MRRRVSMKLGTTYICVDDMEKSLYFYRNFLRQDPLYCNDDRWLPLHVEFPFTIKNMMKS